ncbi:F-box domain-containing protein [Mycena indigotica]|uniref:F-box domain-containing protein n=1 Tax=Mycena indigotica TaxID=2126181 RepID=A0A8H6WCI8_9AGAR|nr:F-box domain-containing protein [Mycena indigotica]KAF7307419.1 F-box domain-containing protein [Mycena indigotica]
MSSSSKPSTQRKLEEFMTKRDKSRRAKNVVPNKVQVAGILELPFELLSEIMQVALLLTVPSRDNNVGRMNYVTGLASICSRLRQVALKTPRLWILEYFDILGYPLDAKTQRFLERSRPCTFRVVITSPDFDEEDSDIDEEPGNVNLSDMVASGFGDTMERWGELIATIHATSELADLAALPPGHLTNLSKLDFELVLVCEEAWVGPPLELFSVAPRLSEAIIRLHRPRKPVSVLLPLPWSQLKHLTIQIDNLNSIFEALVPCKNLVSLSLSVSLTIFDPPFTHSRLTLPILEKLELHVLPIFQLDPLYPALAALNLPALKRLDMDFGPDSELWMPGQPGELADALERFLSHHHTSTSFGVENIGVTALLHILRRLPRHITELTIVESEFPELISDELLQALSESTLVPSLESLQFVGVTGILKESMVLRMILARWQAAAKLKRCRVDSQAGHIFTDEFCAKIRALQDEGFKWEYESKVQRLNSDTHCPW